MRFQHTPRFTFDRQELLVRGVELGEDHNVDSGISRTVFFYSKM